MWLCLFGGRGLCVFGGLCVDMWRLVHRWSFLLFWLSFDCFWRLVHRWYSLSRHVTIGTPMAIFAVLTVFWLFLTIGTRYQSSKQSKPLVYKSSQVCQDCTNSVRIVKNSQKTVKTAKMTISVPVVTSTQSPPNTQSHISSRWNVEHCDD